MHWSFLIVTLAVLVALYLDSFIGVSSFFKATPATTAAA